MCLVDAFVYHYRMRAPSIFINSLTIGIFCFFRVNYLRVGHEC
jgi:hypothetical protein